MNNQLQSIENKNTILFSCFKTTFLFVTFALSVNHVNSQNKMQNQDLIEAKIDSIMPLLTLEEKVAMVHAQSKFSSKGVERLGIPELWMSDGPHGVRAEINWDSWDYSQWTSDSITAFPALTCLAATFNPKLAKSFGISIGEEARYRRKDVLLAPGVNIYRTPLNGRNFEYMGEDPFLASKMVVPYIQGVQQNGVAASVKHYALNNQETWRNTVDVELSDRALHEIYLPAFKAAVQEGHVWTLMGSYNKVHGQYATHNELLMNKILKGDWKFDGVVISDWGSAHDTKEAIYYGLDIEMGTSTNGFTTNTINAYSDYYLADPFLKLLKNGEVNVAVLDDKVRRILRLMYRTTMLEKRPMGRMNNQEHLEVARKVANEGIVLLKNKNNFLPIDANKKLTIAVIGENATRKMTIGGGSSELKAKHEISPLRGLQERYKNAKIIHTLGYASGPPDYSKVIPSKLNADSLKIEAVKIASKADIVLFFGGLNKNHKQDCEDGDRESLDLPFGQNELLEELIKVNPNIAVVIIGGNAVAMPWLPKVNSVMQAWYLGSETGLAIADVISGDVNPSGKLPFSFPKQLKDNAAISFGAISYPGVNEKQEYKEGILVGYRWFDTKKIEPLFAFGYGLSYTNFEVSNITLDKKTYESTDKIKVNFNLKNSGERAGSEVIQVYVGKPNSKVERPLKELKGFSKIELQKGEQIEGSITIDVSSLKYYDAEIQDWNLEKGNYLLYIGNASNTIYKTLKIEIQ